MTTCGIKFPYHKISMNEKLIVNALIKVASVLQIHAELYRYCQRNVSVLADNEEMFRSWQTNKTESRALH